MTDCPTFGVLCCGKDINELKDSVRCCHTITKLMKNGGFCLGGYHTALTHKSDTEEVKSCGEKLYHLCVACDMVFTVGSDGFSADDIIPDVTRKLCESEAAFFTSYMCGCADAASFGIRPKSREKYPPSKGRAGICRGALVLNIRNNEKFITETLPPLLPSISFAVLGLSGKDACGNIGFNTAVSALCGARKKT